MTILEYELSEGPDEKLLSFFSFGLEQSSFYHFLFMFFFKKLYFFLLVTFVCFTKGKEKIQKNGCISYLKASYIPLVWLVTV